MEMPQQVEERFLTAYSYTNEMVAQSYRRGVLFHDSFTNMIVWQCGTQATPWHGEFRKVPGSFGLLDHVHLCFQASYNGSREPRLHSAVLFESHQATFQGYDYKGRFVVMYPLTKWKLDPETSFWKHYADWVPLTREWIAVVDGSAVQG